MKQALLVGLVILAAVALVWFGEDGRPLPGCLQGQDVVWTDANGEIQSGQRCLDPLDSWTPPPGALSVTPEPLPTGPGFTRP